MNTLRILKIIKVFIISYLLLESEAFSVSVFFIF